MESLVAQVVETLGSHQSIAYVAILVIMIVEEAGIPMPIPGDGLLLLAGYLASVGSLSFIVSLLCVVLGALIGASILYWVARRGGRRLVLRYGRYIRLEERRLEQLSRLFGRLGPVGPGVSRLVPGLRIYTSALAGLALISYPLFLLNVAWACAVWAVAFLWLGNLAGAHWRDYTHLSQQITIYSVAALALLLAGWWLLKRNRDRQRS